MEKIKKAIKNILGNIEKEKNMNFIISSYYENLYKYTYNILTDEDDAFDIVQDIFIELENKIKMYDDTYSFTTFLYTIAYRKAMNKFKKNKFWNKLLFWEQKYENIFKEEPQKENDKLNTIKEKINRLNNRERTLMFFKYDMEMKSKDIASILNIKPSYVDVLHKRIIEKFKLEVKNA